MLFMLDHLMVQLFQILVLLLQNHFMIMIFPEFDNMEVIDKIREQYDPLANLVRPHITIVFPFDSDRSNEELKAVLENRLQSVKNKTVPLPKILN